MASLSESLWLRALYIYKQTKDKIPLPAFFQDARGNWIDSPKEYALYLLQRLDKMLNDCNYKNIESLITEIERLFEAGRQLRATQQQ